MQANGASPEVREPNGRETLDEAPKRRYSDLGPETSSIDEAIRSPTLVSPVSASAGSRAPLSPKSSAMADVVKRPAGRSARAMGSAFGDKGQRFLGLGVPATGGSVAFKWLVVYKAEGHQFEGEKVGVKIRAERSQTAEVLGVVDKGDIVQGVRRDNWVQLTERRGFMMVSDPKLGELLSRAGTVHASHDPIEVGSRVKLRGLPESEFNGKEGSVIERRYRDRDGLRDAKWVVLLDGGWEVTIADECLAIINGSAGR